MRGKNGKWDESARQDRFAAQREIQAAKREMENKLSAGDLERVAAIAERSRYRHGEAFMLMTYECRGEMVNQGGGRFVQMPGCGHRETFWNSRDGVTPFSTGCPSCGGTLQHIDWQSDRRAPDHKPHWGQGVWRDGTPDEAERIMRNRLGMYPAPHHTPEYIERLVATARNPDDPGNTEFQRGWPMLERCEFLP